MKRRKYRYKYLVVDNNNNSFFTNNLFYRKFINDHGCQSVVYYDVNKNIVLYAEKLPNGKIIKS